MKKGNCYGCGVKDVEVKIFYDKNEYCKYCTDTEKYMDGGISNENKLHINKCLNILEKSIVEKINEKMGV